MKAQPFSTAHSLIEDSAQKSVEQENSFNFFESEYWDSLNIIEPDTEYN